MHCLPTLPGPTLLVGLTAAENPSEAIGLKLESSIYHSGFDALECLRQRLPLGLRGLA
jgi:hypothetical protein